MQVAPSRMDSSFSKESRKEELERILQSLLVSSEDRSMSGSEVFKLYRDHCSQQNVSPTSNNWVGKLLSQIFSVSVNGSTRLYHCRPRTDSKTSPKPENSYRKLNVVNRDRKASPMEAVDCRGPKAGFTAEARIELGNGIRIFVPIAAIDHSLIGRLGGGI